jgi:hypothetical protein
MYNLQHDKVQTSFKTFKFSFKHFSVLCKFKGIQIFHNNSKHSVEQIRKLLSLSLLNYNARPQQ